MTASRPRLMLVTPPYHSGVVEAAGVWLPLHYVYLAGHARAAGAEARIYDAMSLGHSHEDIARKIDIAAAAHHRAMAFAKPGRFEYEVEAELLHEFRRRGSAYPSYSPILASGTNACILHYVANDRKLEAGSLLLIDAGCELEGYASDITRTFPVSGRFTGPQADIYDLVLDAQAAAIAAIRPGAPFTAPHEAAVRILAQGMVDLKLLEGSVDGVIESEAYLSGSSCTAPGTGSDSMSTMRATTRKAAAVTGAPSLRAW